MPWRVKEAATTQECGVTQPQCQLERGLECKIKLGNERLCGFPALLLWAGRRSSLHQMRCPERVPSPPPAGQHMCSRPHPPTWQAPSSEHMATSAARNQLCGPGVLVLKTQQNAFRGEWWNNMRWWYILRPRVPPATSSPYTSQYHHSNRAVLMLCPGPLHKAHCCASSGSFFSRTQSLLPAPQPRHSACAPPLSCLSVSLLMKNFLWLITVHNHEPTLPKTAPSNANGFMDAYKNTNKSKGNKGFHGRTVWQTLHSVTPTGSVTIYIRMLWGLGIPGKEKRL